TFGNAVATIGYWNSSGQLTGYTRTFNLSTPSPFDPTAYHAIGMLFTGDGTGNYSACSYIDGVRYGCMKNSDVSASASQMQYRYLRLGNQFWCGDGSLNCIPNFGMLNRYIKSVKVLSCANWMSGRPAVCNGSNFNGNFYQ